MDIALNFLVITMHAEPGRVRNSFRIRKKHTLPISLSGIPPAIHLSFLLIVNVPQA